MMGLCVWCSLRLLEAYRKRELALVNLTSYPWIMCVVLFKVARSTGK